MSAVIGEAAAEEAAVDQAFKIETRGVDTVPDSERHGHPRELFWFYFAAGLFFGVIIVGGIVGTMGLPLWAAIAAVLIGNLSFYVCGLLAMAGPEAGTSTIVISRAAFGIRGNVPPNLLSWLTAVGWEAVNVVIGTLALVELFKLWGLGGGKPQTAIAMAIVIVITAVAAVWGHATLMFLQKIFTYLLGIGLLVTMLYGLPHVHWTATPGKLAGANSISTWVLALAIVVAGGGFSILNFPADYTRYFPRSTSKPLIAWYTGLPSYIVISALMIFGVLLASTVDMTNPVSSLRAFLPTWFLTPFLITIVGGTITNNFMNTYSSGLNLNALGLRVARYKAVLVDATLVTILATYALFFYNFLNSFEEFLSLALVWVSPWGGIVIADFFMRKLRYGRPEALLAKDGGPYWYRDGIHWSAIIAFLVGGVVSFFTANSTLWASPISTGPLGGADISWLTGFVVGALVYYVLARRELAAEARERGHTEPVVAEPVTT